MASCQVLHIGMIIYSLKRNINVVYIMSLTMQFSFIMCSLKTSHHAGTKENHLVVKTACSGRLILMALETSHLTSMAVKTDWVKYAIVNLINIIMFSVIIFIDFKLNIADFWEIGQLGSIYASAITSLILYHYFVEQLNKNTHQEKEKITDSRDSFKRIVNTIQESIIIVNKGRIEYVNTIGNKMLSSFFKVEDFFKRAFRKSILDYDFDILDERIFIVSNIVDPNKTKTSTVDSLKA